MSCGYWKAIRRKELEKEKDLFKKKKVCNSQKGECSRERGIKSQYAISPSLISSVCGRKARVPGWGEGRDSDRVLSMSASRREEEKERKGDIMGHCFTELTHKLPLKCHSFKATSFHSVFLRALEIPSSDSARVK